MPRAETPQSSEPEPDPPPEPALRDEKGRFVRPDIARIDAVSEPPGSDTLVPIDRRANVRPVDAAMKLVRLLI
jgi:hypothetical protein